MTQAIPVFAINLDRRPDRLERLSEHLRERGIEWTRVSACDAKQTSLDELDRIIRPSGPLGNMGIGDRACTISHTYAWEAFLKGNARFALILEDDIFLSADARKALETEDWIPALTEVVKLEKYGSGTSKVLLGEELGVVPGTDRTIHRMFSRHVGGGAYIISRKAAELALSYRGRIKVPVDHFLFNDTVSPVFSRVKPVLVQPAIATQAYYEYNSDISGFGKAARPKGWRLAVRKIRRGLNEISQLHRQIFRWILKKAKLTVIFWRDIS